MIDLSKVTAADFESLMNERFIATSDQGDEFEFTLIEVKEEPRFAGLHRVPFSLIFAGPSDPEFSQGVFPLKHDTEGEVSMFLVPVAREESGVIYQSVFN